MRLLLDTHALLWWLGDDAELSESAREAIANPTHEIFVSSASVWEAGIKSALGKLTLPGDLEEAIAAEAFRPLAISWRHASVASNLPRHHDDPFDRMLVAQAQLEGCTLVTRDARIQAYGVPVLSA